MRAITEGVANKVKAMIRIVRSHPLHLHLLIGRTRGVDDCIEKSLLVRLASIADSFIPRCIQCVVCDACFGNCGAVRCVKCVKAGGLFRRCDARVRFCLLSG